jgi:hypothetical protein
MKNIKQECARCGESDKIGCVVGKKGTNRPILKDFAGKYLCNRCKTYVYRLAKRAEDPLYAKYISVQNSKTNFGVDMSESWCGSKGYRYFKQDILSVFGEKVNELLLEKKFLVRKDKTKGFSKDNIKLEKTWSATKCA